MMKLTCEIPNCLLHRRVTGRTTYL